MFKYNYYNYYYMPSASTRSAGYASGTMSFYLHVVSGVSTRLRENEIKLNIQRLMVAR
jgi:hypothetical protein